MDEFLKSSKDSLDNLSKFKTVHVVIGNEAGDLDSAISALVYAYLLYKTKSSPDTAFIGVLNIPQEDYALHTEVSYWLSQHGVSSDIVTFRDQMDLHGLAKDGRLQLTLVDHNVLPASDASLDDFVVEVIDHHQKDRPDKECVPLTIELVGSCCTLVTERLISGGVIVPVDIAKLLYGTIILDTVNLLPEAGRTTPKDEAIISQLEGMIENVNRQQVFDSLQHAKADISRLTTLEILRKDLKVISSEKVTVAISSVPLHIQAFFEREGVSDDIEAFCRLQSAHAVVVMAATIIDGTLTRQLAVYSQNDVIREQITTHLCTATDPSLDFLPLPSDLCTVAVFSQGNVKASRKKILPLLRSLLHRLTCH